ncbi:MAG: hypothetical protein COA33_010760 [Fluviicola sp.]|nr:hypothetical protein [Fluviicola sp.]
MKIVARENIDVKRWNSLVSSTKNADFFSYAWYLDAVAENWCILVNDDYSQGIALPFSIRLGVETLYTPIFVRYVEILGEVEDATIFEELIRSRFKNILLATKQKMFANSSELIYQEIAKQEDRKLGSQAKRMLNKASKSELSCNQSVDYQLVLTVIKGGLTNKYQGLTEKSMQSLEGLFENAKGVNALSVYQINDLGGIVCLQNDYQTLYLKGAVDDETKNKGGMYLALNSAIEEAQKANKLFDFGGSNSEGVKRFNHNLGGEDVVYYSHENLNYPWWYRLLKKVVGGK